MSISSVYVLDERGKVLISRDYRSNVDPRAIELFMRVLTENQDEGLFAPIVESNNYSFSYVKTDNLFIVCATKTNANAALIFVVLHKIEQIMKEYFKELEEESIRDNFIIIYELLDEIIDFGYPQITEGKILKEYVTQKSHKLTKIPTIPAAVTNAVSWRSQDTKHSKNEVFLDVIESVNLLANCNGNVLLNEIVGSIKMRVFLTGMPELRLGLNDKIMLDNIGRSKPNAVELDDVKFHQCVRLTRFDNDRTISFIPPDGDFELMSYRLNNIELPIICIESIIKKFIHSRVEYIITAKSQFRRRSTAQNVVIVIPVPNDVDSPIFKVTTGMAEYAPEENSIRWCIKNFPGCKQHVLNAHFNLPSIECEDGQLKKPIQVQFEVPYFTISGIQVRYLKIIEKSGYHALPWVRYFTRNGNYEIRVAQ